MNPCPICGSPATHDPAGESFVFCSNCGSYRPIGWRPIDTAPKNGRPVLLGGGSFYCESRKPTGSTRHPMVATWDGYGWLIVGIDSGCKEITYDDPRFWMPLEDLPDSQSA